MSRSAAPYRVCGPLVTAAISLLLMAMTFFANAFGLRTLSEDFSQDIYSVAAAPFYPATGQRHVVTVLVDDAAADKIAERYPIGLADHGLILRRILCHNPSVVLVNIGFRYLRDGNDGLQSLYDQLLFRAVDGEGCVPVTPAEARTGWRIASDGRRLPLSRVLLAHDGRESSRCVPFRRDLPADCADARQISRLAEVATPIDARATSAGGTYDLRPRRAGHDLGAPPVAVAFAAFCERGGKTLEACRTGPLVLDTTLVVQWGFYLADVTRASYDTRGCRGRGGQPNGDVTRAQDAAVLLMRRVMARDGAPPPAVSQSPPTASTTTAAAADTRPDCTYSDEINALRLYRLAPDDPLPKAALPGRLVVYGAHITGIPNTAVSPLHGSIPGDHFIAMALDNLVTWGNRHLRLPDPIESGQVLSRIAAADSFNPKHGLEFLLSLALWSIGALSTVTGRRTQPMSCAGSCLLLGLQIAVLAAVGVAMIFALNWPMLNIVAILTTAKLVDIAAPVGAALTRDAARSAKPGVP